LSRLNTNKRMRNICKKPKLATYAILAMVAYLLLLASSCLDGWDDMKAGFMEGFQKGSYCTTEKNETKSIQPLPFEMYFLTVKPKAGCQSYPDSLVNLKNEQKIGSRYYNMRVSLPSNTPKPGLVTVYNFIKGCLSVLMLALYIYIPILFYQLMRALRKEIVFDKDNIRKIKRIGFSLLAIYLATIFYNMASYETNLLLFDFKEYMLKQEPVDVTLLLLGLVTLIIAEIISKASQIKEDQELTI
jgi:hypothetical protein